MGHTAIIAVSDKSFIQSFEAAAHQAAAHLRSMVECSSPIDDRQCGGLKLYLCRSMLSESADSGCSSYWSGNPYDSHELLQCARNVADEGRIALPEALTRGLK